MGTQCFKSRLPINYVGIEKIGIRICSLSFIPANREYILRARSTGKAAITSPLKLLGSPHFCVVLTIPVYKSKLPSNASI
ncbi:CHASE domain containing histidine kinase protein [Artemisia annua]|uniref:CHASE domain containing histidine kinase protein n=1 Tax=Artemisia annua TaxID=35608 RepID=A0A2U1LC76_ARTAN|nr:CHASE domain containing histidine kinase protein [Artemisia annua]